MKLQKVFVLFLFILFISACSKDQGQKDAEIFRKLQELEQKSGGLQKQVDAIKVETTINDIVSNSTPQLNYELPGIICKLGKCGLDDDVIAQCVSQCRRAFPNDVRDKRSRQCCSSKCEDRLGSSQSGSSGALIPTPHPSCQFNAPAKS